jgi:biopolymer transport protein TolR
MERRARKRKLSSEINVVPYIDVMLVLLIIFMVTAPLLTQGVEVELPQADAEPVTSNEEPVTLYIDARGRYYLDIGTDQSKPLADDDLVRRVSAVLRNKPQTTVLVKGDKRADYGKVANGLSLLQQAGAARIGFVTEPVSRTDIKP